MKHLRTEVEGSQKKRIYDKPLTPFERLKACTGVDRKRIDELERIKASFNPFELKRVIEKELRRGLRSTSSTQQKTAT